MVGLLSCFPFLVCLLKLLERFDGNSAELIYSQRIIKDSADLENAQFGETNTLVSSGNHQNFQTVTSACMSMQMYDYETVFILFKFSDVKEITYTMATFHDFTILCVTSFTSLMVNDESIQKSRKFTLQRQNFCF
jgi:hypothetical protein